MKKSVTVILAILVILFVTSCYPNNTNESSFSETKESNNESRSFNSSENVSASLQSDSSGIPNYSQSSESSMITESLPSQESSQPAENSTPDTTSKGTEVIDRPTESASDYEYKLVNGGKTVLITKYTGNDTNIKIPQKIDNKSVVAVDSYAFKDTKITSVVVPDTILQLNEFAFADAKYLKKATLGKGITLIKSGLFMNCTSLTDVYIAESVSYDPDKTVVSRFDAFTNVPSRVNVHGKFGTHLYWYDNFKKKNNIKTNINYVNNGEIKDTYMLSYQFIEDYSKLELVNYSKTPHISSTTSLSIPQSFCGYNITSIGNYAFFNDMNTVEANVVSEKLILSDKIEKINSCSLLNVPFRELTIPDKVVAENISISGIITKLIIGKNITSIARIECPLEDITIPDNVVSLEEGAFKYCSNLKSIKLSKNLESIPIECFHGCKNLKSINLPNSIKSIGALAFYETSLTKLTIPSSVKSIGAMICNVECSEIILNEGLETIGVSAFNRSSISTITIPSTVTSIGNEAFRNCKNLTSVNIQCKAVIPYMCFYDCTALKNVTVGSNVKIIETECFGNCSSLESVTFSYGIEELRGNAFFGCTNLKIIKLPSSIKVYKDAIPRWTSVSFNGHPFRLVERVY